MHAGPQSSNVAAKVKVEGRGIEMGRCNTHFLKYMMRHVSDDVTLFGQKGGGTSEQSRVSKKKPRLSLSQLRNDRSKTKFAKDS